MIKGWIEIQFEELVDYIQPTEFIVRSTDYRDSYKIPVLTAGKSFIKGYTNEEEGVFKQLPVIIFDDFTTASRFVNFPFKVKSSAMKILVPSCSLVNLKYVFYGMQITDVRSDTHKRYWISDFAKRYIPLPPLNEQNRITDTIEELFSELDHGVANLKKAQSQLKVYRQALLKQAFEGKLTEQWRKANRPEPAAKLLERIQAERENRYEQALKDWKAAVKAWEGAGKVGRKPGKPRRNVEVDFSIRDYNVLLKVEDTSTHIVDCLHSTAKFQTEGKYCVDTTCIIDGQILWDKIRFVTEESFKERISRLKPEKGDIFFAREGTVGTTLVLNNEVDICLGQRMMMFRPYTYILSKYFMYYFQSIEFKKQYKPFIGGTTAPHLNIGVIKKLIFPVCSIDEQRKIIDELDDRISIIDNLEQTIASALQKSEALHQSILKQAFEGKLVPQDPEDEPASELLKRIQAEKAAYLAAQQQQKKRKTTKKTKSA